MQHVNGNVALTLEKLPGIRGDLTRIDSDWENWDLLNWSKLYIIGHEEIQSNSRVKQDPRIVTIVDLLSLENYIRDVIKINHEGACIAKIKMTNRMNAQR